MRLDGWESRLAALVEAARHEPYVLGSHDCFRMACRAVEALTGVDRWPEWAGRYSTRREAMALLAAHGSTFEAAFDWFFGVAHVAARWAQRGDLLCMQTVDGEKHLAVCLGANAALLGPDGLKFVPTAAGLCCWRIA